jgi:hypothetical protein
MNREVSPEMDKVRLRQKLLYARPVTQRLRCNGRAEAIRPEGWSKCVRALPLDFAANFYTRLAVDCAAGGLYRAIR